MTIPGLRYIPEYLTQSEQERLLALVDQQPWLDTLQRRVQHYGYRYDYKARRVDASLYLGDLPAWLSPLAQKLHQEGFFSKIPDQVIINEYQPGQGIGRHIDCVPCFGPTIASISLASRCVMEFIHAETGRLASLLLAPGSLLLLQGEARYAWQHRIHARKRERFGEQCWNRERRVSLTFRTVLLG